MDYKVNSVKKEFLEVFKALYEDSFPANERRDFAKLEKLLFEECFRFQAFMFEENGEFSGFLTYWKWDDFRYFEHYAVMPEKRNGGRGAEYLRYAVSSDSTPVVLEVEPPADDLSRRRIAFYQRNGFRLWDGIDYLQPPYGEGLDAVPLKLMTSGDMDLVGSDDERILRIKREVYGFW